jgi:hypothetical protein
VLARANDPAQISADTALATLLWDAADALGERDREVLDLTLRHNLPPAQIAEVLDINRNAANQLVHRVRQRLGGAVGARILWRDGTPTCPQLRADLAAADVTAFDTEALRVTDRHAGGCETCADLRRTELEPSRLFAAIPILVLPALKAKVAAALAGAGVPMGGSRALNEGAGEYTEPDADRDEGRGRRTRRFLTGAALVFVILVLVVIVGASRVGDMTADLEVGNEPSEAAAPTTTTATSSTTLLTTTTVPASTTTTIVTPTTTAPVVIVPPTVAPVATTVAPTTVPVTTTTVAPTIRMTLSPSSRPRSYLMAGAAANPPVLTWAVTPSSYEVHVSGNSLSSDERSATQRICPGRVEQTANGTFCFTDGPGDYDYTLEVLNADGKVVAEETRTLTITP